MILLFRNEAATSKDILVGSDLEAVGGDSITIKEEPFEIDARESSELRYFPLVMLENELSIRQIFSFNQTGWALSQRGE